MAEQRVTRRLAAVLAADVVGYTRLMKADEETTLAAWWAASHWTPRTLFKILMSA